MSCLCDIKFASGQLGRDPCSVYIPYRESRLVMLKPLRSDKRLRQLLFLDCSTPGFTSPNVASWPYLSLSRIGTSVS